MPPKHALYILNTFLLKPHFLSVNCTGFRSIWQVPPWITKEDHLLELESWGAATTFPSEYSSTEQLGHSCGPAVSFDFLWLH